MMLIITTVIDIKVISAKPMVEMINLLEYRCQAILRVTKMLKINKQIIRKVSSDNVDGDGSS